MHSSLKTVRIISFIAVGFYIALGAGTGRAVSQDIAEPVATGNVGQAVVPQEEQIEQLNLPEDMSPRLPVRRVQISGNRLIGTEELLRHLPAIYNASEAPLKKADSESFYDFRILREVITQPGEAREVSARTIQGFTRYLLSVYQRRNYGGIYVYVPAEALQSGKELPEGVLPVRVLEAHVGELAVSHYDPNHTQVEKGYLRASALRMWSPAQSGKALNRRELDDFVNLLNLNPDRYVSAKISPGAEPNALAVGYNIYEAKPWHTFIQIDNSGTDDRQWTPRVGLINTNLLGFDDTFSLMYQAGWDSTFFDEYLIFGSYNFPVWGPRLRATAFAGYNEFDVNPESGPINFIGAGTFYGGSLRYNVLQASGWFFDVTSTLSHEESKVTPSIFPQYLGSDVAMNLLGWGVNIHKKDDLSSTSLSFEQFYNVWGSDEEEFLQARTDAERDFIIYTTRAYHSRYLTGAKVQRLSGSLSWITSNERLVPAKMTTFGGMYSVRGYDEYEIVADGGMLVSGQYEYDLVAHEEAKKSRMEAAEQKEPERKPFLRKLAPLAFIDYGMARIKDATANEDTDQELFSLGIGLVTELGDNFSGVVYYGWPLIATEDTRTGKGRVNAGMMLRW